MQEIIDDQLPINDLFTENLSLVLQSYTKKSVVVRCDSKDVFLNPYGFAHGGFLYTIGHIAARNMALVCLNRHMQVVQSTCQYLGMVHSAPIICLRHKFQHHPGTACRLGFVCLGRGFPEQAGADHGVDHTGNGGCRQTQLMGNLHPGNGTVPIDMFLNQIVVALLQNLMVASLFAHKVILQIHCTSYSIEGDITLSIVTFMKNQLENPNRISPEGEFPINMKGGNVPTAYKGNLTLPSIYPANNSFCISVMVFRNFSSFRPVS